MLVRGEISESRLVAVEELHATDGIRCGQVACHAPVEERLQDREILVDGGVSDFLSSPQFDVSISAGVIFARSVLALIFASHTESAGSTYE